MYLKRDILPFYFNYKRLHISLFEDKLVLHANKTKIDPLITVLLSDIVSIEVKESGSLQYVYKLYPGLVVNRTLLTDKSDVVIVTNTQDTFMVR